MLILCLSLGSLLAVSEMKTVISNRMHFALVDPEVKIINIGFSLVIMAMAVNIGN